MQLYIAWTPFFLFQTMEIKISNQIEIPEYDSPPGVE